MIIMTEKKGSSSFWKPYKYTKYKGFIVPTVFFLKFQLFDLLLHNITGA